MNPSVAQSFLRQYRKLFLHLTKTVDATQARQWLGYLLIQQFLPDPAILGQVAPSPLPPSTILTDIYHTFDRYPFTLEEGQTSRSLVLTPAILGSAYETLQLNQHRKTQGIFFTPPELVHYMCQQSLAHYLGTALTPEPIPPAAELITALHQLLTQQEVEPLLAQQSQSLDQHLADLRVLDPAIGTGAFLVAMVQTIVQARIALTPYLSSSTTTHRTHAMLLVHALQSSIYGWEIDADALNLAYIRLLIPLLLTSPLEQQGQFISSIQNTLRCHLTCGNFLVDKPGANNHRKAPSSFHILIGNPPYIRIHKQDPALKATLKTRYQTAHGDYDTYILFFERGLQLLQANGVLSYITPDKFLIRAYGQKLKALLLQYSVLEFLDLSRARDVFSASAYPLVTLVQKNQRTSEIRTKFAHQLSDIRTAPTVVLPRQSMLTCYGLLPLKTEEAKLLDHLRSQAQELSQILRPGQLFCGTPRAKDYHRWKDFIVSRQQLSLPVEHKDVMRVLVCGHLKPYWINSQKHVRAAGISLQEPYFFNQPQLISSRRWQEFSHAPKILIRGNDTRITAVLDRTRSVFIGIYGIKIEPNIQEFALYLLALLNSQLYQWILATQYRSSRIAGDFFSITSLQILSLPFKLISQPEVDHFTNPVSHILNLTGQADYGENSDRQAQVQLLQQELNHRIYHLFGLSNSEIQLIEQLN